MKRIITLLNYLCLSAVVFAQSPEKMSYQAVVRDANNNLIVSSMIGMQLSILKDSVAGTAIYVETQTPTSNEYGLISIEIGAGTQVSGSFASIDWANGTYFIKIEIDPMGGINYDISGTSQLLSVPYAMYAKSAGSVSNGSNYTHYIGEVYGGGVIFHLWKDSFGVEHGLILDLVELSTGMAWSNVGQTQIGMSASSIWDGLGNSNAIVNQAGHTTSAAAVCLNSTNGGQNDWYLPSIQELSLIWNNYYEVSKSLSQIAGATMYSSGYWSSTEYGETQGWYLGAGSSFVFFSNKGSSFQRVRAIRSF